MRENREEELKRRSSLLNLNLIGRHTLGSRRWAGPQAPLFGPLGWHQEIFLLQETLYSHYTSKLGACPHGSLRILSQGSTLIIFVVLSWWLDYFPLILFLSTLGSQPNDILSLFRDNICLCLSKPNRDSSNPPDPEPLGLKSPNLRKEVVGSGSYHATTDVGGLGGKSLSPKIEPPDPTCYALERGQIYPNLAKTYWFRPNLVKILWLLV